jgi:L-lactate permease
MQELLHSGGIADLMVGVIVAEMLALGMRRPDALRIAMPSLCSGLCLALALRCALTGSTWPWVALWIGASGTAHGFEMFRRWRN